MSDIRDVAVSNGIPITDVKVTTNKNTVVSVPNQDVLEKLKPLLAGKPELRKYEVAKIRDKLPRLSVLDVQDEFDENNFIETIKSQNPNVANVIGQGEGISDFYIKKYGANYQVNINVTENIRKVIKSQGNRLFIGLKSCRVVEKENISRCYKCHDHEHIANDCSNIACCGYCADTTHASDDCPLKVDVIKNKSRLKCINCERNGLESSGHSVYWPLCPMNKRKSRLQGNSR